ncbi:MAG: 5-formyltetrahydrofolate cyclo-ligase [Cellvibrionaceae bacterium]
MTSIAATRSALRKQLRQGRRKLSRSQQKAAADNLCRQLTRQPLFIRSRHIALYLPSDGEIDPRPIVKAAWKLGKRCYLPVLKPGRDNQLWFIRYQPTTALRKNRFGIFEPKAQYRCTFPAQFLDLVLMPLVGFDENGGRMGMGGGFYDRAFAFKKDRANSIVKPPYLLGLAHECQRVEQLQLASWDIPLNAIATDQRLIVNHHSDAKRCFISA